MQLEQIHYPFSDSKNIDINNIIMLASIAFIIMGIYGAYKLTTEFQNNK